MSEILTTVAAALPIAAGWSVHSLRLRRRVEAARRDPLTGLPTRDAFTERAARTLAKAPTAIYVIDLVRFKQVNDTHGHAAGDAVIRASGERLAAWARAHEGMAARLGGDEFAAFTRVHSHQDHVQQPKDLAWALEQPVRFEGQKLTVEASIGTVAHSPADGADLPTLMRIADEQMYAAKRIGIPWLNALNLESTDATVNGRRHGRPGTAGWDGAG
ncbi:GGDEF domain-containing protein [Streptomyces luteireticuli]|uniref:GGDEF domain-containing protein n=1 Tax=Streptomyces luteireticuli TaxID=173858 RepID=A0ABN0Y8C3_9ACTN